MRPLGKITLSLLALALMACVCHGQAIFRGQNVPPTGGGGGFAPTFFSVVTCTGGQTGCTNAATSVTSGQFAVCWLGHSQTPTTFTVTDTDSDAADSPSGSPDNVAYTTEGFVRVTLSHTNASEVLVLHTNASGGGTSGGCAVFNGTPASGWDTAVAGHTNTSTTSFLSGTTSTTTAANELAVAVFTQPSPGSSPTWTGASGYTCTTTAFSSGVVASALCYKALTSTGTQQATATAGASISGDGLVSTIK